MSSKRKPNSQTPFSRLKYSDVDEWSELSPLSKPEITSLTDTMSTQAGDHKVSVDDSMCGSSGDSSDSSRKREQEVPGIPDASEFAKILYRSKDDPCKRRKIDTGTRKQKSKRKRSTPSSSRAPSHDPGLQTVDQGGPLPACTIDNYEKTYDYTATVIIKGER